MQNVGYFNDIRKIKFGVQRDFRIKQKSCELYTDFDVERGES